MDPPLWTREPYDKDIKEHQRQVKLIMIHADISTDTDILNIGISEIEKDT